MIWNIEEGLKLTVEQLERAEAQRVAMTARTLEFFDKYDLLLCPATIVPPFPVENRYVAECAGKKFDNYVEWLGIVYAITLVCCPALSLPCGFTASGLPVGLQVVAPPRGEAQLLAGSRCWRIFWACAARRRSIRGRRNSAIGRRVSTDAAFSGSCGNPARPVVVTCCYARRTDPGQRDRTSPSWRPIMTDQAIKPADDHFDIQDVERRIKAIFIGSIGNLVEWYDFYAYTAFALYFAPAFFPNSDPVVQQLNAAVLFAATFLMRPLGGWLFGFIADRHGRRLSLTLSVVCMCFGSLIIAVTPTYATIGIAAPAILALARIIEGLSLGGEYGASATYLTEVADPKHRGFYSSFQYVTLIGGQLTAIIVLLLLQKVFLTPEQLKDWGWRIPFVIGALLAIFAAVMRRNLHETEAFEEAKKLTKPTGSIRGLLKYPRELLLVVGLTAGGTAAFYTFTTYMQTFVRLSVGLTEDQTTFVIFGSLIFATLLQPIYGAPVRPHRPQAAADLLRRRRHAGDGPDPDHAEGDQIAVHGLPADLRRLDLRRRLHLDQRHREGRTVPDQCPRARRRPALCHHGIAVRRHRAGGRALFQDAGA